MLLTLIKKELVRVFTDKKLVFTMFILPPLLMLIMYTFMGYMISKQSEDIKEHKSTIIIQNAPQDLEATAKAYYANTAYLTFISGSDIAVDTYHNDILEGKLDLFVYFDNSFMEDVINYANIPAPPQIKTYYNDTENYSSQARNVFVTSFLTEYEKELLKQRFGNINAVIPFTVDTDNKESIIHDQEKANGQFFSMLLPMFIIMFLFSSIMGISIEAVAGEKERGTMATLLLTPVPRLTLALGKIIGLLIISFISAFTMLAGCVAGFPMLIKSIASSEGSVVQDSAFQLSLSGTDIFQLAVMLIALAFLFLALVCLASVISRNTKEATTLITPMTIIIIIVAYSNAFSTGKTSNSSYLVPVYSAGIALKDLLEGTLTTQHFIMTTVITLIPAAFLIVLIGKCYKSEKIMLNA